MNVNSANLTFMAGWLEDNKPADFSMSHLNRCVMGKATSVFENRSPADCQFEYQYHSGSRIFGVAENTPTWIFCFGARWTNCVFAAAQRLRYVAIHGEAPDESQWPSFEKFPRAVVEPEDVEIETLGYEVHQETLV